MGCDLTLAVSEPQVSVFKKLSDLKERDGDRVNIVTTCHGCDTDLSIIANVGMNLLRCPLCEQRWISYIE